jgi:hypothetical protein
MPDTQTNWSTVQLQLQLQLLSSSVTKRSRESQQRSHLSAFRQPWEEVDLNHGLLQIHISNNATVDERYRIY